MKDLSKEEELEYRARINRAFTNNGDKISGEDYSVSGLEMARFLTECGVIKEEKHPYLNFFELFFAEIKKKNENQNK